MTLLQLIHSQNEMIRLKGTAAHEEQKKIVNEQRKKANALTLTLK